LVEIPVPRIPYHKSLEDTQLAILQLVASKNQEISNALISKNLNLSPQVVSYHIKELQKKKLITVGFGLEDSRKKFLSLTNAGYLVAAWTKKD
jgi:DNA-binding MarR family transcriptional regulator